jgi:hypothetical protein
MAISMLDQFDRQKANMRNMGSMMARLNVDPAVLPPHVLGPAVGLCLGCESGDVCRDWLAQAAPSVGQAPVFCPNAKTFARVRAA